MRKWALVLLVFIATVAFSRLDVGWPFSIPDTTNEEGITVPGAVLSDGMSAESDAVQRTRKAAEDELNYLAERVELPPLSLNVIRPMGWSGVTVITSEPTRYDMVIAAYSYVEEGQVHRTVAHEVAHVLMAERGWTQSEALADTFALCYGSPQAQKAAHNRGIVGECSLVGGLMEPMR